MNQMNTWTQDEAINYECACEAITHLMAIYTERIAIEEGGQQPDITRIAKLRAERTRLHQERSNLHIGDQTAIAQASAVYGAEVRAWAEYQPDRDR